ncbi:metalloregulator ArsR/SmtB family transcription factor [bacterium]|nr:metalloregulator ArsR/SmtB family transcription factor [bacterium]
MSSRKIVAEELAKLFSALSHPDRIRIVEELATEESDVQSLSEQLDISPSRVSQHLSTLRAQRVVSDRREGKRHIYHLDEPGLAGWILDGVNFTELQIVNAREFESAVKKAKKLWSQQ